MKPIICAEGSADGWRQFAVENEETFDGLNEINSGSSDECGHYGGLVYDVFGDSKYDDVDGPNLDPNEKGLSFITESAVDSALTRLSDAANDDDNFDDMASEEDYEDEFMGLRG